MFLEFSAQEVSNLSYTLKMSKKHIKKGLKKSHGSKEGKRQYEMFKSVLSLFQDLSIDSEIVEIEFNEEQLKTLNEFLFWYVSNMKNGLGSVLSEEEKRIMSLLESAEEKVKGGLLDVATL